MRFPRVLHVQLRFQFLELLMKRLGKPLRFGRLVAVVMSVLLQLLIAEWMLRVRGRTASGFPRGAVDGVVKMEVMEVLLRMK